MTEAMNHVLDLILWLVQITVGAMISAAIKLGLDDYFKTPRMYPIG